LCRGSGGGLRLRLGRAIRLFSFTWLRGLLRLLGLRVTVVKVTAQVLLAEEVPSLVLRTGRLRRRELVAHDDVRRDASGLDRASPRRVVARGRQAQRRVVAERQDRLNRSLAERLR